MMSPTMTMPGMAVAEGNSPTLTSDVMSGAGDVVVTGSTIGASGLGAVAGLGLGAVAGLGGVAGFFLETAVTGYLVLGVVTTISTGGSSTGSVF
jgi:hypothetical protein